MTNSMGNYTYLAIDILTILFPFLLSFDKKVHFYKYWKSLFVGIVWVGSVYVCWDVLYTYLGVWSFNARYTLSFRIGALPLEEWLFFLVVPYACAFIYTCLNAYFTIKHAGKLLWSLFFISGIMLIIIGIIFHDLYYTAATMLLAGAVNCFLYFVRSKLTQFNLRVFLYSFLVALIPFLIVNGLLTSLPVVLYNNAENLGIRIYTIPVEDVIYGYVLLLGTIVIMQQAKKAKR
ncbi:MAG: lycopene cyclase domain-containing protein [Chitinophagaceae bacterium]|nr:lycopene cyclase domain-containing protein [Chitinophagaceae bacterium]